MKTKRGKPTDLIILEETGELLIPSKVTGISNICLMVDGLPFTTLKGRSSVYYKIDTVIRWYEDEIKVSHSNIKYKKELEEKLNIFKIRKKKHIEVDLLDKKQD